MGFLFRGIYVSLALYTLTQSAFGNFIGISIVAILAKLLYQLVLYPAILTPLKQIPTPAGRSWITGNSSSIYMQAPLKEMREWINKVPNKGLIRYYIAGNIERLLVTNPRALSEILVTRAYDITKPASAHANLAPFLGDSGVFLADGDEHKRQRKSLMPAFAYRHIKNLYPQFWAKSMELVESIRRDLKSREDPTENIICFRTWAGQVTLDITGVAGMDYDFNSLGDPDNMLRQRYNSITKVATPAFSNLILAFGAMIGIPDILFTLPFQMNIDRKQDSQAIRDVAYQMICQKKERLKDGSNDQQKTDIISVALQSGAFTEDNLVDQMMTFLHAGHETTSTALLWAVYALCKHPDVQARLREEVRHHLPFSTDTAVILDTLPYLQAFCNEVLRFYPPIPITIRTAIRDTTLIDTHIPKGTVFLMVHEFFNRSKQLWGPDAGDFNPDRWLGSGRGNGGTSSNYALLTFIHGPRSCMGQSFAKAELMCLISAIAGHFHVELETPGAPLEVEIGATAVYPKDGVLARFTPLP